MSLQFGAPGLVGQVQMQHHGHHQPQHMQPQRAQMREPGKPPVRGKTSPYGFFVKMCYEEHKKKYPNENVQVTEISKKCSEKWKTMTDDEKRRFFELAQKDAERYAAEIAAYGGEDAMRKRKRAKKDPNAPKRALSAFFFFSQIKRNQVSAEHTEWKVGQVAQELGRQWKLLTEEERKMYEKMATDDKTRYELEMRDYKAGRKPGTSLGDYQPAAVVVQQHLANMPAVVHPAAPAAAATTAAPAAAPAATAADDPAAMLMQDGQIQGPSDGVATMHGGEQQQQPPEQQQHQEMVQPDGAMPAATDGGVPVTSEQPPSAAAVENAVLDAPAANVADMAVAQATVDGSEAAPATDNGAPGEDDSGALGDDGEHDDDEDDDLPKDEPAAE